MIFTTAAKRLITSSPPLFRASSKKAYVGLSLKKSFHRACGSTNFHEGIYSNIGQRCFSTMDKMESGTKMYMSLYPEGSTDGGLRLGNIVPDFSMETTHGNFDSFHEWKKDKWAILFSHPADFTRELSRFTPSAIPGRAFSTQLLCLYSSTSQPSLSCLYHGNRSIGAEVRRADRDGLLGCYPFGRPRQVS